MFKQIVFLGWAIFISGNVLADALNNPCHQYYPNIPGEVLLENDKVVVQKFHFSPWAMGGNSLTSARSVVYPFKRG